MVALSEIKTTLEELKRIKTFLEKANAPEPVKRRNQFDIDVLEELLAFRQKDEQ
jgi:hypothetical protein